MLQRRAASLPYTRVHSGPCFVRPLILARSMAASGHRHIQHLQVHALGGQPVDQLQETQRVASQPVQRGHHQDFSGPDNLQQTTQARSQHHGPCDNVLVMWTASTPALVSSTAVSTGCRVRGPCRGIPKRNHIPVCFRGLVGGSQTGAKRHPIRACSSPPPQGWLRGVVW